MLNRPGLRFAEPRVAHTRAASVVAVVDGPRASRGDDAGLVAAIGRGDAESLRALYDRYGGMVYTVARRIAGDAQVAEEVTQDVFLSCWQRSASYQAARGGVHAWLIGIARNRAIDYLRGRQHSARNREAGPTAVEPEAENDHAAQVVDRVALDVALATLSAGQREAIVLAFYGGLTQQQVADLLDVPLGTVKTRIRDGMLLMRRVLAAPGLRSGVGER